MQRAFVEFISCALNDQSCRCALKRHNNNNFFVEFRKKDTPSSSMSQQLVLYTENVLVSEACIVAAEKAS